MEKLRLLEFFIDDNSEMINSVAEFCIHTIQGNKLIVNEIKFDSDVYVGNYFEEVVPEYNEETYRKHFRITRSSMQILLQDLIEVIGENNVNNMTVSLDKKLHFTLWMLANHAVSYRSASDLFGFSKGTAHLILINMCNFICQLKNKYIQWPTLSENINNLTNVERTYGYPGVIGCIDGCHIPIKAPKHNPVDYYNRKCFHSVILQGVCNNNLEFIDIFVGMPGRVHDARVFRCSQLYQRIDQGLINHEQHLLGDSAYPIKNYLLTPYRDNGHLTDIQKRHNKKHAAARSVIERAFGILKGKFRRLKFLDMDLMHSIPNVITACCILHNVIIKYEGIAFSDSENDEQSCDILLENINDQDNRENNAAAKQDRIATAL